MMTFPIGTETLVHAISIYYVSIFLVIDVFSEIVTNEMEAKSKRHTQF